MTHVPRRGTQSSPFPERKKSRTMETINDMLFRHSITTMDTGQLACLYNHSVEGQGLPRIISGRSGWVLDDGKVRVPLTPTEVKIQVYTKGLRRMKENYVAAVSDPEALEQFAFTLHENPKFKSIPTSEFVSKVESLCEADRELTFNELVNKIKTWRHIP